jgi:hypothetical protein
VAARSRRNILASSRRPELSIMKRYRLRVASAEVGKTGIRSSAHVLQQRVNEFVG